MELRPWQTEMDWHLSNLRAPLPPELAGVPGIKWSSKDEDACAVLHNTHLPLIDCASLKSVCFGNSALPGFLYDHQLSAILFASTREGVLCCDPCRMGKTPQTVYAHVPETGALVVVAPLSAMETWQSWIRERFGRDFLTCLTGKSFDRKRVHEALRLKKAIFCHYDILEDWASGVVAPGSIGMLVCDEAHILSKKSAARTRAAMVLASGARRRICLTGTPIWNTPAGLWSILSICNPGAWGSYYEFAKRYADGQKTAHGFSAKGISNTEELHTRLKEVLLYRKRPDTAPRTYRRLISVDLSPSEKLSLELQSSALLARHDKKTAMAALAELRQLITKVKLPHVEFNAHPLRGRPLVIWVWHRSTAKAIAKSLGAELWTGDTSIEERGEILDKMRRNTDGILVCTMAAAGAGTDFSFAKRALVVELDWTPAVVGQAEMRTYHPADGNFVDYLVCNHAIERKLLETLIAKLVLAEETNLPASEADSIDLFREALGSLRSAA